MPDTSFERASAGSSLSKMPATCFTCWPNALYGVLWPYGVERPRITRPPWSATSWASSRPRRDLPIPAGPKIVTKWARASFDTRSQMPDSASSSRSRPIIATGATGRSPMAEVGRSASQARTGALLPLARTGWAGRYSMALRVLVYVSSPTMTAPDRGGRLEARRRVDDVARDHGLAATRYRLERDDRLAGVHGDPHLEPVLLRPVPHGECRSHSTLGVVAVRGGRTEDAHHGVPDELLDHAAVSLELSRAPARSTASGSRGRPRGRASRPPR